MYENTAADFHESQRVQVHPATDTWMRGLRYGTVVDVDQEHVYVRLDRVQRVYTFSPGNLTDATE